ncbi:MAG TPA: tetratricopeptide repeat protein [Steroidobacteraceae bacterium]|nr:tetratricopeptide repeat protein [Steroidobacteraceae bacterium]
MRDPATTDLGVLLERLPHGLRPLTRLSYFLDARLYGMQPAGFLSTNLLLHAITVLLVFALARRRLDNFAALAAALLFAVQPANAEVVAYISGRSTGLMTPLLLGGLLLYDHGKRLGALLLFCLACLAKEHALIFPALVIAWESTRSERRPGVVRDLAIAIVLAGIVAAVLLDTDGYRTLLRGALSDKSMGESGLANARAIPQMLSLWVRPWALSVDHEFDQRLHVGASIAGLAFLFTAAGVAFALRRRRPMLALAIAWTLIALLPTNSLLAKPDLVTEKPLYLAWVAVAIALGAAVPARRALLIAAALLLCALIGASFWRVSVWRDPVALWTDAVAKAPRKSRCWNNLGMAYLAAQRVPEAVNAFERAVFLDPRNEYATLNLATARALCTTRRC